MSAPAACPPSTVARPPVPPPSRGVVRVYQGVAYFHPLDAPDVLAALRAGPIGREFPALRAVAYGRGVAFQVRVSGDYLGPDLRPSMETAMGRFDRA